MADYIASSGSNELSVSKGQQVEIIEPPTASEPDFCLVRLNPQHDDSAVQEGLVPVSVLKPPPGAHKQGSSGTTAASSGGGATQGVAASKSSQDNMQDQGECCNPESVLNIPRYIYIYIYILSILQAIAARQMHCPHRPSDVALAGKLRMQTNVLPPYKHTQGKRS